MITSSSLFNYNTTDIKKTIDTKIVELSNDGFYDYMPYPEYFVTSPEENEKFYWGDSMVIKWNYTEPRNNLISKTNIDLISYWTGDILNKINIISDIPTSDKNVTWKIPLDKFDKNVEDYSIKIYSFIDDIEISDTSKIFKLEKPISGKGLYDRLIGQGDGDATLTIYGFVPNFMTSSFNFVVSESKSFRFNYDTSNAVKVYMEKASDPVFIEQLNPGFGIYTIEDVRNNDTYTITAKDYVGKEKRASFSITEYITPFDFSNPNVRDCIFAEGPGNALLRLCGFSPNVTESKNIFVVSQSKDFRFNYSSSNATSVFLEKQSDSSYIQELGTSYGTFKLENLINDDKYKASVIDDDGNVKIVNFGIKIFKYVATPYELSQMTLYDFAKYSLSLAEESLTSADSILSFVGEDGNITTSKFIEFVPLYIKEIDEMSSETPCRTIAILLKNIFNNAIIPLQDLTGKSITRLGQLYYSELSTKGYLGISLLREKIENVVTEYNIRKQFNNFCGYVEPFYPPSYESDVSIPTTFIWKINSSDISFYGEDGQLLPYFSFDLQVSTDDGFNNIIIYKENINSLTYETEDLKNDTTYYWRVRLKNTQSNIIHTWSVGTKFSTIFYGKAGKPILISPENNTTQLTPLLFTWNRQNSVKYRIEISDNESFYRKELYSEIESNSYLLTDNFSENKEYFWRVQSFNNQSVSLWSDSFKYFLEKNTEKIHCDVKELIFGNVIVNDYKILQYSIWTEDVGPGIPIYISAPSDYKLSFSPIDLETNRGNEISVSTGDNGKLENTIIYVRFNPSVSGQSVGEILHRIGFGVSNEIKRIPVNGTGISDGLQSDGNIILKSTSGNAVEYLNFGKVSVGSNKVISYDVQTTVVPGDLHIKSPNQYLLTKMPYLVDVSELILHRDNNNAIPKTTISVKFIPGILGAFGSKIEHYIQPILQNEIKKDLPVKGYTDNYGDIYVSFEGKNTSGFLDFGSVNLGEFKLSQYLIQSSDSIPGDVVISSPDGYLISEAPYTSYVKNITIIRDATGKIGQPNGKIIAVKFNPLEIRNYDDTIKNSVLNSDQFTLIPVRGSCISAGENINCNIRVFVSGIPDPVPLNYLNSSFIEIYNLSDENNKIEIYTNESGEKLYTLKSGNIAIAFLNEFLNAIYPYNEMPSRIYNNNTGESFGTSATPLSGLTTIFSKAGDEIIIEVYTDPNRWNLTQ